MIDYIFTTEIFKKFVNKRNLRPSKYYGWGTPLAKRDCMEGDNFLEIFNRAAFILDFEDAYFASDLRLPSNALQFKPQNPLVMQHSTQILLNGRHETQQGEEGYCDYLDELSDIVECVMQLKEVPIAVSIKNYYCIYLLYQRTACPKISTKDEYAHYIDDMLMKILPMQGYPSTKSSTPYDWGQKPQ